MLLGSIRRFIMKTYDEQNYPVSIDVRVSYPGNIWLDGVKGLNVGHAMYLASENWPGAEIELIKEGGR